MPGKFLILFGGLWFLVHKYCFYPIQCQGRINLFWALKMKKWTNKTKFPVVFGKNECVHRVLRLILNQKRPARESRRVMFRVFDFFIFWSFSDINVLIILIQMLVILANSHFIVVSLFSFCWSLSSFFSLFSHIYSHKALHKWAVGVKREVPVNLEGESS